MRCYEIKNNRITAGLDPAVVRHSPDLQPDPVSGRILRAGFSLELEDRQAAELEQLAATRLHDVASVAYCQLEEEDLDIEPEGESLDLLVGFDPGEYMPAVLLGDSSDVVYRSRPLILVRSRPDETYIWPLSRKNNWMVWNDGGVLKEGTVSSMMLIMKNEVCRNRNRNKIKTRRLLYHGRV